MNCRLPNFFWKVNLHSGKLKRKKHNEKREMQIVIVKISQNWALIKLEFNNFADLFWIQSFVCLNRVNFEFILEHVHITSQWEILECF